MHVICVLDNTVQRSSPFWGEHGLAFLIETEGGHVLFDTGQSGIVLLHNLELLDIDPATIDALAISHAHYDHTGGLQALLEHVLPGIPLYAHSDIFRKRFSRSGEELQSIGLPMTREALAAHLTLCLNTTPQEILPSVWTTGEISERPEPEGRSEYHLMREGDTLVADVYRDDMALVLKIGDSLVILCGCCHAGLLNTIAHVERTFEGSITVIAGGLHLASSTVGGLRRVGEILLSMSTLQNVYPNHCTGEDAFVTLTQVLGPSVVRACPAGTKFELNVPT